MPSGEISTSGELEYAAQKQLYVPKVLGKNSPDMIMLHVKDIEEINWIIRLHPDRVHYQETGERDLCQIALTEMVGQYKHVFDMPASIASSSLFKIVTAVVTADGTAGYEYPAMGIPCIIACESRYSGNGFTIEPKNADEYRNALINVARLEPLNAVEINRALFFCYIFYFLSMNSICYKH